MSDTPDNGAVGTTPTTSANPKNKRSKKKKKKREQDTAQPSDTSKIDEKLANTNWDTLNSKVGKPRAFKKNQGVNSKVGTRGDAKKKIIPEESPDEMGEEIDSGDEMNMASPIEALPVPKLTDVQHLAFELHSVYSLQKKSPRHPNALFRCHVCIYHCDTTSVVEHHIQDARHLRLLEDVERMFTLNNLPCPNHDHCVKLTELIINEVEKHGLSEQDLLSRQNIASVLSNSLSEVKAGFTVRLYGSSASGFGLKSSDVNLELCVPSEKSASKGLSDTRNHIVEQNETYRDVKFDFIAEIPTVEFTDIKTNLKCCLTLSNGHSYKISELLKKYTQIDERVRILGVAFRIWSKSCKLESPECGTWPAYAFPIMIVHFLQNAEFPILPVLHELVQQSENDDKPDNYLDPKDLKGKWSTDNHWELGVLWIELFKFYACDSETPRRVITIQKKLSKIEKTTRRFTRKLTIRDPFLPRRSVSSSGTNPMSLEYLRRCFQTSYKYFAIPQTESGQIFNKLSKDLLSRTTPEYRRKLEEREEKLKMYLNTHPYFVDDSVEGSTTVEKLEEKLFNDVKFIRENDLTQLTVSLPCAEKMFHQFKSNYLHYEFKPENFIGAQKFPEHCTICQKSGHTKRNCVEVYLPRFDTKLPKMPNYYVIILDTLCADVLARYATTKEIEAMRKKVVSDIEEFLIKLYPTVSCQLFGSSCNGFGLISSDIDICLTFTDSEYGEEYDFGELIEELQEELRNYTEVNGLLPITTAKVPILKFHHKRTNLEGDISVYNTLGLKNTLLLRTYADLDHRAKMLGYMIKRFAKVCDIGDASRGSLSSYAYIIMLIYFLQQCDPPVLPVLQQLYEGDTRPEVHFDKYDVYFYDNLQTLSKVWPDYGKNKKSVGQLWIELLKFYCEFDFNRLVITIRRREPLLKFEKLWNSKYMAIEDPFDFVHNLGTGLSRKMHTYIVRAFRNGYKQFGIPRQDLGPRSQLEQLFFQPKILRIGEPPNDRGCRVCKKIGHLCRDCPMKVRHRGRQQNARMPETKPIPPPQWPFMDAITRRTMNMPPNPIANRRFNPTLDFPIVQRPKMPQPPRLYNFNDFAPRGGNFFRSQERFDLRYRQPPNMPRFMTPFKTAASPIDLHTKNGLVTLPPFSSGQRDKDTGKSKGLPPSPLTDEDSARVPVEDDASRLKYWVTDTYEQNLQSSQEMLQGTTLFSNKNHTFDIHQSCPDTSPSLKGAEKDTT